MKVTLGWRKFSANYGRHCAECGGVILHKPEGAEHAECKVCGCKDFILPVAVTVKPLTVEMLLELLPLFKFDGDKVVLTSFLGIQKASAPAIMECVKNLTGLTDEDGAAITLEQVTTETVLTDLAVEIATELVSISRLNLEEQGN